MRQVQKETHILQSIITTKLIPELEERKEMINKKGYSKIIIELHLHQTINT